jgi:hypothetical protein
MTTLCDRSTQREYLLDARVLRSSLNDEPERRTESGERRTTMIHGAGERRSRDHRGHVSERTEMAVRLSPALQNAGPIAVEGIAVLQVRLVNRRRDGRCRMVRLSGGRSCGLRKSDFFPTAAGVSSMAYLRALGDWCRKIGSSLISA